MADESFEGQDVEEPLFLAVLKDCVEALARHDVPYAAMGGIASSILGRDRWTHDIDLFVAPGDAGRALEALADAVFVRSGRTRTGCSRGSRTACSSTCCSRPRET